MIYGNTIMMHINKEMNHLFPVPSTMNNKKLIQLTSKLMESFENNIELRRPIADGIIERCVKQNGSDKRQIIGGGDE